MPREHHERILRNVLYDCVNESRILRFQHSQDYIRMNLQVSLQKFSGYGGRSVLHHLTIGYGIRKDLAIGIAICCRLKAVGFIVTVPNDM